MPNFAYKYSPILMDGVKRKRRAKTKSRVLKENPDSNTVLVIQPIYTSSVVFIFMSTSIKFIQVERRWIYYGEREPNTHITVLSAFE